MSSRTRNREDHVHGEIAVILQQLAESGEFVSAVRAGVLRWLGALDELFKARGEQDSQLRALDKELSVATAKMKDGSEGKAEIEELDRRLIEVNESCCRLQLQLDEKNRIFNFEASEDLSPDEACVLAACLHLLLNRSEAMLPPVTDDGPYHEGHQHFFRGLVHDSGPDQMDAPVFERVEWALTWVRELPFRLGFPELSDSVAAYRDLNNESVTSADPFSPDNRYFTWNGEEYRLPPLLSQIVGYLYEKKAWGKKSLSESNIQAELDFDSPIRSLLGTQKQIKRLLVRPKGDDGKVKRAEWQLISPRSNAKRMR